MTLINIKKLFCRLPFSHVFIDEQGHFYPCCLAISKEFKYKDIEGKDIHASDVDFLEKVYQSPQRKRIQELFLHGIQPECCKGCFAFEKTGGISSRQSANLEYENIEFENFVKDEPLCSIDLRLGNNCNLKCQMCHPRNSKVLENDFLKIWSFSLSTQEKENLSWIKSPHVFIQLKQKLIRNGRIHFAGGEPFIIKEAVDFLKLFVEDGSSFEISLSYNTNFSVFPSHLLESWERFKSVNLIASIDGTFKINEYIRYPLIWSRFDYNLNKIFDYSKKVKNINLNFHTVVQFHNIFNIISILEYTNKFTSDTFTHRFDFISGYYHPFSARNLPVEVKKSVKMELNHFLNSEKLEMLKDGKQLRANLLLIFKELDLPPLCSSERSFYYSYLFDRSRGHTFFDVEPEFKEFKPSKKMILLFEAKYFFSKVWWRFSSKNVRVWLGRFIFSVFKRTY